MSVLIALILGVIQGLTEFVPVSSTAHLYLAQALLGIRNDQFALSFDIALHLGTALALVVATRRELLAVLTEAARWSRGQPARDRAGRAVIMPLLIGTLPGVFAGLFLLRKFEEMRSVGVIGVSMLIACGYFFLAENFAERRRESERTLDDLDVRDGFWIGLAQAAAGLMAGFSRSGFTIATGKLRRIDRQDAARFSFLLALPIILGAGLKALLDLRRSGSPKESAGLVGIGFVASALVGYFAIRAMLRFVKAHSLRPFGIYLGVLGSLLVLSVVFPGLLPFSGPQGGAPHPGAPKPSITAVRPSPLSPALPTPLYIKPGRRKESPVPLTDLSEYSTAMRSCLSSPEESRRDPSLRSG